MATGMVVTPSRFAASGGGGGWGWNPTMIAATRVFYLRADDTSHHDLQGVGGDEVERLADFVSHSYVATKYAGTASKRAKIVPAVVGGLPVIRFHQTSPDVKYGLPSFAALNGGSGGTLLTIVKKRVHPSVSTAMSGPPVMGSSYGSQQHFPYTDGTIYYNWGNDRYSLTAFNTATAFFNYRHENPNATSPGIRAYVNGTLMNGTYPGVANTFSSTPQLGYSFASGDTWYDGDILEMGVWDGLMTAGEITSWNAYAAARISGAWLAAGGD